MKNRIFYCTITFLIHSWTCMMSQDFHLAQPDANPFFLNPALSGERLNENHGIKFNANYREQTARYSKAVDVYKTVAFGIDIPINKKLSISQYVSNNKSVGGSFNSFNLMLGSSYKIIGNNLEQNSRVNFSFGFQIGILNNSIRPKNFTYGNQYSPYSVDGFDRSISNGETFDNQSSFKLDANFGIYYRNILIEKKLAIFGGVSMYHLTDMNDSYLGNVSPIYKRINIHIGSIFEISKSTSFVPQLFYMNQGKANDLNAGFLLIYKIKEEAIKPIIGLGYRANNALIFHLGVKTNSTAFRVSYCQVLYDLSDYKNSGIEFSLIHCLKKKQATVIEVTEQVPHL